MASRYRSLSQTFSWTKFPLIAIAPMSGIATGEVAAAVTWSGRLGFIGFTGSPRLMDLEIQNATKGLDGFMVKEQKTDTVPIGIGMILTGSEARPWTSVIGSRKPAVVWLSFGTSAEFKEWTLAIREASPATKIWIQLGTVTAALDAARLCGPDALVLQGSDAGGHGHENGSSIVSLVPEVADTLKKNNFSHIPLVAAGGIMDGRGTAAALVLRAAGVVMGTRFLGAAECYLEDAVREEIFAATDGGQSTVISRVWDDIWGPNAWPSLYNGRCLRNAMYDSYKKTSSMKQVHRQYRQDLNEVESGRGNFRDVVTVWAGTGVGMVNKVETAKDIVEKIRAETLQKLQDASTQIPYLDDN